MMKRGKQRGSIRMTEVLLGFVVAGCLAGAALMQHDRFAQIEFKANLFRQRIKLPSSEQLKFLTIGYDNVYANWLWLQSIQAFGSGWITEDGTTTPIYQYFDTMTDIDPHFIPSYRFGNLIIGDNRFDWKLGQDILRKGVFKNPHNYDIPYLGLYNAIWMYDNLTDARWFAHFLRRIPTAPGFMHRMEEYVERRDGRFELAFETNIRFYLKYLTQNNEIERDIIQRRLIAVSESMTRKKIEDAAWAYHADHGVHPSEIELLITPKYLPATTMPTVEAFSNALADHADAIDSLPRNSEPPEELVQTIFKQSQETIAGLPPDPFGTWYLIWEPAYEYFHKSGMADQPRDPDTPLHYVRSARDLYMETNEMAMKAQGFIMSYVNTKKEKPSNEDLKQFLTRDPFGGHYVYKPDAPESPEYGVFYSTTGMRQIKGQEPRVGVRGPGPFPFKMQARLHDHPEDFEWGWDNGFIQFDGKERWEPWEKVPAWRKTSIVEEMEESKSAATELNSEGSLNQ